MDCSGWKVSRPQLSNTIAQNPPPGIIPGGVSHTDGQWRHLYCSSGAAVLLVPAAATQYRGRHCPPRSNDKAQTQHATLYQLICKLTVPRYRDLVEVIYFDGNRTPDHTAGTPVL